MAKMIVNFSRSFGGGDRAATNRLPPLDPPPIAGSTLPMTAVLDTDGTAETVAQTEPLMVLLDPVDECFGRVGSGDISTSHYQRWTADRAEWRELAAGETVKIQAAEPA